MRGPILLDAGPLVALCAADDPAHAACRAFLGTVRAQFVTTWPVLTEAAYLLRKRPDRVAKLFDLVGRDGFAVVPLEPAALPWIAAFLRTYPQAQVADASLMLLAEDAAIDTVFTLDRRDFAVYRTSDRRALTMVPSSSA